MPRFRVNCYDRGVSDKQAPREVEAESAQAAAESVCGKPLVEIPAKPGLVRAKVWEVAPGRPDIKWFRRATEG